MKLTPLQIETLRQIEAGKVYMERFGNGASGIRGSLPTVVGRLVRTLGLAEWSGDACVLTDKGREEIAARSGSQ